MGFFGSQGQVTPKFDPAEIRTHPRIYGCPSYLQVWWSSDQNWRRYRSDKVKYGLFFCHSRTSNSEVTPKWIVRSGRNLNSSKVLWLSWLPARLMKIRSKVKQLLSGHFLHYKSMGIFFATKGRVTPKWIVRSGQKSKLSEILWMSSLPASLTKLRSKMK